MRVDIDTVALRADMAAPFGIRFDLLSLFGIRIDMLASFDMKLDMGGMKLDMGHVNGRYRIRTCDLVRVEHTL